MSYGCCACLPPPSLFTLPNMNLTSLYANMHTIHTFPLNRRAQRSRIKSGRRPQKPAPTSTSTQPPAVDRALLESLVHEVMTHPRKQRDGKTAAAPTAPKQAPAEPAKTEGEDMGREDSTNTADSEEAEGLTKEFEHIVEEMRHKKEERDAAADLEARRLGVRL